ncbi:MAG: acetolactate synthase large subunit [Pseudonocardiales bacterium]|nr:acetolactate synthase large subunit [Pseudonocardiales bacterium]
MNGARSLLDALMANGVDVCFANPGTSEMHFVAALDQVDGMRCVLGLFEGVVTGAADGYARMADRPAATLLHLGPGLANGLSNLHNAMRAHSPIVNVIGDHATYHRHYDAPLTSDIEGTARPFSHWVRTSPTADTVAEDAAAAVAAARTAPGRIASLILPADAAWSPVSRESAPERAAVPPTRKPADETVEAVAEILRSGKNVGILLGPSATRERPLELAGKIAGATGARLFAPTHIARISRGAGRVPVQRLPYPVDQAVDTLRDIENLILVGAKAPVAFFAYPDKPSRLVQPGTHVHELARPDEDTDYALRALVEALDATQTAAPVTELTLPARPDGTLTPEKIGALLGAMLPEHAIVVDESITTGRTFLDDTRTAHPHDWILGTGGAIGYALPCATGAAIACPDRKTIVLESDGSGMYMPQALWTHAREGLNILTLVFANHRYQILRGEMANVGATREGANADTLLNIDNPRIDWVALARTFGIEAFRAQTADELARHIEAGLAIQGPCVIEVAC